MVNRRVGLDSVVVVVVVVVIIIMSSIKIENGIWQTRMCHDIESVAGRSNTIEINETCTEFVRLPIHREHAGL